MSPGIVNKQVLNNCFAIYFIRWIHLWCVYSLLLCPQMGKKVLLAWVCSLKQQCESNSIFICRYTWRRWCQQYGYRVWTSATWESRYGKPKGLPDFIVFFNSLTTCYPIRPWGSHWWERWSENIVSQCLRLVSCMVRLCLLPLNPEVTQSA